MNRIFISLTLLLFISFSAVAQDYVAGEIMVRLTDKTPIENFIKEFNQQEKNLGELSFKRTVIADWNLHLLTYDSQKVQAEVLIELVEGKRVVSHASLNYIAQERNTVPDDSRYEEQWNLDKIEVEKVWDVATGGKTKDGKEIVAMVVDGGFDVSHVEFAENIWVNPAEIPNNNMDDDGNGLSDDIHGFNFVGDSSIYTFDSNHGTAVAGMLGAKGNNGEGMSGVVWDVKMMFCQASTYAQIIEAYNYAYEQRKLYNETDGAEGAFVVTTNASLGFGDDCDTERPLWNEVLDRTGMVGILNVGASVNASIDVDVFGDTPTSCSSDFIVTVTNTDITDEKVGGAGYGKNTIDIGSPGGTSSNNGITTLAVAPGDDYRSNFAGCSAAAPIVAGTIALMYSLPCDVIAETATNDPAKAALLMKRSLLEAAEPNASLQGITVSEGRLNAYRSMLWWQSYCADPSEERVDVDAFIESFVGKTSFTNIFPNPADTQVTFKYSIDEYRDFEVKVFDVLGRLVYQKTETATPFSSQSFDVDTSNWADGVYHATIKNGKELISAPLVVIHGLY